jgi:hypothetical protein
MIERKSVSNADAAVMSHNREMTEPKVPHDVDLVPRHCALRVVDVIYATPRLVGRAIAPEVSEHDGEMACQNPGNSMPAHVRLRKSVQHE